MSGSTPVTERVVTGSDGRYMKIVRNIDGKYRLTPGVGDYQFTPSSAQVSGSGGTADFTGTRK